MSDLQLRNIAFSTAKRDVRGTKQDGSGIPVDFKFADVLVRQPFVGEPVEQLPAGKAGAPKQGVPHIRRGSARTAWSKDMGRPVRDEAKLFIGRARSGRIRVRLRSASDGCVRGASDSLIPCVIKILVDAVLGDRFNLGKTCTARRRLPGEGSRDNQSGDRQGHIGTRRQGSDGHCRPGPPV